MQLLAYGINHHTAPVAIREKCAFNATQLPSALTSLYTLPSIREAMILSTCNRTEIYTNAVDVTTIRHWLTQQKSLSESELSQHSYAYHDMHAVRHIMRVASGLDSMVLGESQILGQLKQAYQTAKNTGTVGNHLKHLFPMVFETSKHIRTETKIGAHPISLAYAITQLSKNSDHLLSDQRVLLIGAGETIELIATHLHGLGVKKITIANRTLEKIQPMMDALQAQGIQLHDIPVHIKESDIVISATASQLPILGKGLIENTLKDRKNRRLLLIDLAVPRDIEPEVAELPQVQLYNLDDLQAYIAANLKNREDAAKQAETLIELQTSHFMQKMRVFHARHVIAEYRDRLDKIRLHEQEKALHQLTAGYDPRIVLEEFGRNVLNKIMHHPTIKLREAASEEKCEIFQRIKTFFEL